MRLSPAPPALTESTKNGTSLVLLKLAHQFLALLDLRLAMQHEAGPPEHGAQERRQWRRRLLELGEDKRLLLPGGDHLRDVAQTCELAAVLLGPRTVAEPLRGMVADLLQPHEKGQHDASALHPIDLFELAGEIVHRLLVKRRLLAAQGAEGFHLGLVGQVGNDALVGLQAPQDIGAHQVAERAVRVMRPVGEAFDEGRKLLRRSQQARIDEIEDRP